MRMPPLFIVQGGFRKSPRFYLRLLWLSIAVWPKDSQDYLPEGTPWFYTAPIYPWGRMFYFGPAEIIIGP